MCQMLANNTGLCNQDHGLGISFAGGEHFGIAKLCSEAANYPFITTCTNLHCNPCLYARLNRDLQPNSCPVCRIPLIKDFKIIPVYGIGGNDLSETSMENKHSGADCPSSQGLIIPGTWAPSPPVTDPIDGMRIYEDSHHIGQRYSRGKGEGAALNREHGSITMTSSC